MLSCSQKELVLKYAMKDYPVLGGTENNYSGPLVSKHPNTRKGACVGKTIVSDERSEIQYSDLRERKKISVTLRRSLLKGACHDVVILLLSGQTCAEITT